MKEATSMNQLVLTQNKRNWTIWIWNVAGIHQFLKFTPVFEQIIRHVQDLRYDSLQQYVSIFSHRWVDAIGLPKGWLAELAMLVDW